MPKKLTKIILAHTFKNTTGEVGGSSRRADPGTSKHTQDQRKRLGGSGEGNGRDKKMPGGELVKRVLSAKQMSATDPLQSSRNTKL